MQEKNLINVMVGKNQQRWRNSVVSGVAQYCIRKFKKPHALTATPTSRSNTCKLDTLPCNKIKN